MTNDNSSPRKPGGWRGLAGPLGMLAILVAASLYASGVLHKFSGQNLPQKTTSAGCSAAMQTASRLKPLVKGEIAALQVPEKPTPVRELNFQNAKGEAITLASLRGKVILLNLWATWCAPCRKEMPALDALQAQLGGTDFEVVAVNIDTRNLEKPREFLKEIEVKNLAYHADPSAKIFQDLKAAGRAFGMPTTLLIDAQGCELATLAGPAEWSSPEAQALVRAAITR